MINRQKWCDKCGGFVESIYAGNPMFCRCDPKVDHINKLEADVAKLNHQLLKTENDLLQSQDINSFLDAEFRIACKRAERAEAEVERLQGLLAKAIDCLESSSNGYVRLEGHEIRECLSALRGIQSKT
jgi:septal ring factor EnvC (AmiA/AmiB activator)